jgi:hypothetical protein
LGSPYEGERAAAMAACTRMLANHWEDIAASLRRVKEADEALHRAEIADAAAEQFAAALAASEQRVAELEAERAHGPAVAVWQDVTTSSPQEWARWALAEHAARRLYLNRFETEFLPSIADWVGSITVWQEPVFQQIRASVTRLRRQAAAMTWMSAVKVVRAAGGSRFVHIDAIVV